MLPLPWPPRQSRRKHEGRGEAPWAKPLAKLLCFENIRMDRGNVLKHTPKKLLPPKSGAFWGLSTLLAVWQTKADVWRERVPSVGKE